jgi:hypothetical protein
MSSIYFIGYVKAYIGLTKDLGKSMKIFSLANSPNAVVSSAMGH